jgi:3',5'-cyclic AMP phosphodiesterase CpdA
MDLNYLQNEIIPKREKEIKEGKNLATRQPIYVVLDLQENIIDGHIHYSPSVNYKGKDWEHGYADRALDSEDMVFNKCPNGMENPKEFTRFYTDRIIAFFFTSEAAQDYLNYQSHNLSDAYVYVFYSGYANYQMDKLLCNS